MESFQIILKSENFQGERASLLQGNLMAVHWKDKRDVFLASTIHGNAIETVKRRNEETEISKPSMICKYNKFMNGVDKYDQYLSTYSIQRKTR